MICVVYLFLYTLGCDSQHPNERRKELTTRLYGKNRVEEKEKEKQKMVPEIKNNTMYQGKSVIKCSAEKMKMKGRIKNKTL